MKGATLRENRIVVVTPENQGLFGVKIFSEMGASVAITFYDSQECLNMLLVDEDNNEKDSEQMLGETEMRLSFLTNALNWQ